MRCLFYRIDAKEPLKMNGQKKAQGLENSMDYIAGSTLRGALVGAYVRALSQKGEELSDRLKQRLLKKVFFLNAYPLYEEVVGKRILEKRALPAPPCFYGKKSDLSAYDGKEIAVRSIQDFQMEKVEPEERVWEKEPFICMDRERIYGIGVEKEFRLHVSVNAGGSGGQERTMFRYEVIRPGQSFCGVILTEDEALANDLIELLRGRDYYLGGSKGSGYGLARITFLREEGEEAAIPQEWREDQKEFYIYYLSDAVLYDEDGNLTGYLPESRLEMALGIKGVKYIGGPGRTVGITGYNSVWRSSLPQLAGIKAGTIHKYVFKEEVQPLREKILSLQEKGVGLRRQDGYGRILILPEGFTQKSWQQYGKPEGRMERLSEEGGVQARLEGEDRVKDKNVEDQALLILEGLYQQRVSREIDRHVVETAASLQNVSITHSQLGKLLGIFQGAEYSNSETVRKEFRKYISRIEKKERNTRADEQLTDTCIMGQSLKDYLDEFTAHCDDVDTFIEKEGFRPIRLGNGISRRPDREEVFRYNMIFMNRLLKYLLRQKREG